MSGLSLERFPADMKARDQWLLAGPNDLGELKVPASVAADGTLCPGSSTNRATWLTFERAHEVASARGYGLGYVLAPDDPFACIDLDVKEQTTQAQLDRHWKIVQAFDSYTEFSQSGKGLHVWVIGKVGKGKKRDYIEVYSENRFIACTGRPLLDKPIAERQQWLSILHAEIGRGDQPQVELEAIETDDTDLSIAMAAMDGDGNPKDSEMGRLFAGNWGAPNERYPSQSEADLALVKMFARLTQSNEAAWGAFLLSKLGQRDKAERPDYRRRTLAMARTHLANDELMIAHGRQVAEGMFWRPAVATMQPAPQAPTTQWPALMDPHFPILFDDDLMKVPQASWIVKNIIPAEGIGSIYGPSGSFKSFVVLDLLAHVSHGLWWFGCRTVARPVVYVPFEGKSGVPNRIRAWQCSHQGSKSNIAFIFAGLNLRNRMDRDKLVKTLLERSWAGGVLCIDTLAQSGPGINENDSEGMGEMIAIFQELQQRLGGVVLVVHHTGKDASRGLRGWSGLLGALDFAIECEAVEKRLEGRFNLAKVKDGEAGRAFDFQMLRPFLYHDADGDEVTSLAVQQKDKPAPAPEAAATNDADDDFIWHWASRLLVEGKRPSERALKADCEVMKPQRAMSHKRILEAVARLKSAGRLLIEKHAGNNWLRAIELTTDPLQWAPSALKPDA